MHSFFTILGLEENDSEQNIEAAYQRLRRKLDQCNFTAGSPGSVQARQCLMSIDNAYRTLIDPASRKQYEQQWKEWLKQEATGTVHPKIGQLCVAAGIMTLEELEAALQNQEQIDLPIGQILQERKLISQAELDSLLLGQQLITLPASLPHKIGRRLVALGLVTEDMIRIALIEQRTINRDLQDLLVAHGWLDAEVLKILTEPTQSSVA